MQQLGFFPSSSSWTYRIPHPAIGVPRKRNLWEIMVDDWESGLPVHAGCLYPLLLEVPLPLYGLLLGSSHWVLEDPAFNGRFWSQSTW